MPSYGAVEQTDPDLEADSVGGPSSKSIRKQQRRRCQITAAVLIVALFGILPFSIMMYKRIANPGKFAVKHFSVFFIRHAEKPDAAYRHPSPPNNHLSDAGWDRAKHYYPRLFCDHTESEDELCQFQTCLATLLVARDAEAPHFTMREIETLQPLATTLGKEIEQVTLPPTVDLVHQIFDIGRQIGTTNSHPIAAIVSWEHHNLRHLGKTFGCSNKNSRKKASCPAQLLDWPDEDFGSVVEFIYSYTDANPEKTILAETATYDVDDITQTFHAL